MIKNKKAEEKVLTPNFITLVIGVLGLVLVFGGAYLIYKNVMSNPEVENAKNTLNTIIEKIEIMKEGKGKFTIQGFEGSEKWFLMSWNENDLTDTKPEKCFLESCLCICKPIGNLLAENYNWKENCGTTNQGFCIEIKNKDILINKFGAPTMKPSEGVYYGQNLNPKIIQLHPNLMELHVEKIQNIINITYYKQ